MEAVSNCLITGGAGLIGRALARELSARGWRVTVLDDLSGHGHWPELPADVERVERDVRDVSALRAVCTRVRPRLLFHLAAVVGVRRVLRDPKGVHAGSLAGVEACLSALEQACPHDTRLVFASSSEVYADQPGLLDESSALRTQCEGRWAYAAAKLEGERRVLQANPLARVVRFFNVVGPGQSSEAGMVLPRFVERARAGLPLELYGDGSAQRCYAHVDEVARVLAELAAHPRWQEPVLNVGGKASASARALAQCVLRHSGSPSVLMPLDPERLLGGQFAEVRQRTPDLGCLQRMGIALPVLDLDAIVLDMLARHPRVEAQACASPA